jgi:hypothetical protein
MSIIGLFDVITGLCRSYTDGEKSVNFLVHLKVLDEKVIVSVSVSVPPLVNSFNRILPARRANTMDT